MKTQNTDKKTPGLHYSSQEKRIPNVDNYSGVTYKGFKLISMTHRGQSTGVPLGNDKTYIIVSNICGFDSSCNRC